MTFALRKKADRGIHSKPISFRKSHFSVKKLFQNFANAKKVEPGAHFFHLLWVHRL